MAGKQWPGVSDRTERLARSEEEGCAGTYDSRGNLLTADQVGTMGSSNLAVDNFHTYDTGDRLLTTRYNDPQEWDATPTRTSWFSYDDLGP